MKSSILYSENRGRDFLGKDKNINLLSGELKDKIRHGKMKLVSGRLYVRKDMTGMSGTQDLIESGDTKKQGIRNIDNAKLPTDNPFIIAGIKVACIETTATDPASVSDYTSVRKSMPAGLVNSKFEIIQDGAKVLEMEIVEATTNSVTASVVGQDDIRQLEEMALLIDNKEFEWKITTPSGVAISPATGTNKLHVEVMLFGWEIRKDNVS